MSYDLITVNLQSLRHIIIPHVPDCPDFMAALNLRLAAVEFCERTCAWRHVMNDVPHEVGQTHLIVPPFGSLHRFEFAEFNGEPLTAVAFTDVVPNGYRAGGRPAYVSQVTPETVQIMPDAGGMLTLSMFLKPRFGQQLENCGDCLVDCLDEVPDFLVSQFGEVLVEGALARLMEMQKSDWYNPKQAAFYRARFDERAVSNAHGHLTGQQRVVVRTKTHWF